MRLPLRIDRSDEHQVFPLKAGAVSLRRAGKYRMPWISDVTTEQSAITCVKAARNHGVLEAKRLQCFLGVSLGRFGLAGESQSRRAVFRQGIS